MNERHQNPPVCTGEDKHKHAEKQIGLNSSDPTHTGNSPCNTLKGNVGQVACKYMERGSVGCALVICDSRNSTRWRHFVPLRNKTKSMHHVKNAAQQSPGTQNDFEAEPGFTALCVPGVYDDLQMTTKRCNGDTP